MADTPHGPKLLLIAIGFAIGAAIGFTVANSMSRKPAPSVPAVPLQAAGSTESQEAPPETGDELSEDELRIAMAAVDARPKDFEAQFKMGEALLRISRRPVEAVRYYERAVALRPNDAEALVGLGDANFASALGEGPEPGSVARLDAAQGAYERAVKVAPKSAGVLAALGSAYAMRKPPMVAKARAAFERALAIDPQNALARRGLAGIGVPATNGPATGTTPSVPERGAKADGRPGPQ